MTAGRPLEAITEGLRRVWRQTGATASGSWARPPPVRGAISPGILSAPTWCGNEITAQATAAAAIDPEEDTIFEIGGQDSKFISLSPAPSWIS